MELKRLGLASQPWIVVPNHIIEQVGREAKQWYPAANVLVGAGATNAEGRRRFAAQTATGDWDMVIVPKSVFTAIKVSPQRQQAHLETARDQLMEAAKQAGVTNTKQIEAAIKDQDSRLAVLTEQAGKDTGLTWEMVGADYIFLDEAHLFKNRERVSAVRELACTPGSQQAEDLVMKLDVLRESRRDAAAAAGHELRPGQERVATFSTGTPVANSLGEMWVMQSYLRPDLLADAGVADVDGWGAVFTGTTSGVEMNASGSRLQPVTRVGRFVNVPELVTMSSVYTDVVTRDDITVALPELVGGARQVISKPASQEVRDFISDLAYRSEHFDPGRPDIDNSLKVANDGRNVSLDERMANLEEPLDGGGSAWSPVRSCASTPTLRPPPTVIRPAGCPRWRGACRSCSATVPPRIRPAGSSPCTRGCARNWWNGGWRSRRSGSSTTTRSRGRRRSCSMTAGLVGCRWWWGLRRRWAPAPTFRTGRWRCITWTCRGARRIWSSGRAASCARATRTRGWRS